MACARGTLQSFWSKKPQPRQPVVTISKDTKRQDKVQGSKDVAPTDGIQDQKAEDNQAYSHDTKLCEVVSAANIDSSQGPKHGEGGKKKRKRDDSFPSSIEAEQLEALWQIKQKPKQSEYEELAKQLLTDIKKVKKWFADKRKKMRTCSDQPASEVGKPEQSASLRKPGLLKQEALASGNHEVELSQPDDDTRQIDASSMPVDRSFPTPMEGIEQQTPAAGEDASCPHHNSTRANLSNFCDASGASAHLDNSNMLQPSSTSGLNSQVDDPPKQTLQALKGDMAASQQGPQKCKSGKENINEQATSTAGECKASGPDRPCVARQADGDIPGEDFGKVNSIRDHQGQGEDIKAPLEETMGDNGQSQGGGVCDDGDGQAHKRVSEMLPEHMQAPHKRARESPADTSTKDCPVPASNIPFVAPGNTKLAQAKSAGKKKAGPPLKASMEDCAGYLSIAREEAAALREALLAWPLLVDLPELLVPKRSEMKRAEVAGFLGGCRLPLSLLVERLWLVHTHGDESSPLSKTAVRNLVLDLGCRRSFSARDGGADALDALEDTSGERHWFWEVRDTKILPKNLRTRAVHHSKLLHKVADRLTVLLDIVKTLEGTSLPTSAALSKIADRLSKSKVDIAEVRQVSGLPCAPLSKALGVEPRIAAPLCLGDKSDGEVKADPVSFLGKSAPSEANAPLASSSDDPSPATSMSGPVAGAAASTALVDKKDPAEVSADAARQTKEEARLAAQQEKDRAKREKAEEKERLKKQKEEEREKAKQMLLAEKEKARAEKAVQQEVEREAKEKLKAEKKKVAGFGSAKKMEKSRSLMAAMFLKTPAPSQRPSPAGATPPVPSPFGSHPEPRALSFHDLFSPAPEDLRLQAPIAARTDRTTSDLIASVAGADLREEIIQHWKRLPKHRRVWGLPPSWARRHNVMERVEQLKGSGSLSGARLWRRKFIWFPADSPRPPYYGSWSKSSQDVRPRQPFGKDGIMDYDVMSDQEWEEEPEGEELSDNEIDEEEDEEGSLDGGFVVQDGYMSEDEGIQSPDNDLDDLCAELEGSVSGGPEGKLADPAASRQWALLEATLEKSRRCNRPLIISRLPSVKDPQQEPGTPLDYMPGDASLLSALKIQILTPGLKIVAVDHSSHTGASSPKAERSAPSAAKQSAQAHEKEILPLLLEFITSNPAVKAAGKLVQAFLDRHQDRKIVKKWVHARVREMAIYKPGSGWELKPLLPSDTAQITGQRSLSLDPAAPSEASPSKAPDNSLVPGPSPPSTAKCGLTPSDGPKAGKIEKFFTVGPKANKQEKHVVAKERLQTGDGTASSTQIPYPGLGDPFWRNLEQTVAQPYALAQKESSLASLFGVFHKDRLCAGINSVPAFIITALVKCMGSIHAPPPLRRECASATAALAHVLAGKASAPPPPPSPMKVWANERASPPPVCLEDLLRDPLLISALSSCFHDPANPLADLLEAGAYLLSTLASAGNPKKLSAEWTGMTSAVQEEPSAGEEAMQIDGRPSTVLSLAARAEVEQLCLTIASSAPWRGRLVEIITAAGRPPHLVRAAIKPANLVCMALSHMLHHASIRKVWSEDADTFMPLLDVILNGAQDGAPKAKVKFCVNALVLLLRDPISRSAMLGECTPSQLTAASQKSLTRLLLVVSARLTDNDIFAMDADDSTTASHPKMLILEVLYRIVDHVGPAALTENDPKSSVPRAVLACSQSSNSHLSQAASRVLKLAGWQAGKAA